MKLACQETDMGVKLASMFELRLVFESHGNAFLLSDRQYRYENRHSRQGEPNSSLIKFILLTPIGPAIGIRPEGRYKNFYP